MSKPVGALCHIRWSLPEFTGEEEAIFLIGDTRERLDECESEIVKQIENKTLNYERLSDITVLEINNPSWFVVRTGQQTTEHKFVVTTPSRDIEYIYKQGEA